jgi:glutathione peroxidase
MAKNSTTSIYDFSANSLGGKQADLAATRGKVLLIVNTASKCGFTPQFDGLEKVYEKYRDQGFEVLGFPCNQFGAQEPGSSGDIAQFCTKNYGVTFPMFEKVDVNGEGAHPLYKWLKAEAPGVLGTKDIKWNFTKFLVGRDGKVVDRYAPTTRPDAITGDIDKALKA